MEYIFVKEEVIDEKEFETHPVSDTGVGENVKEEIDFEEELEMDLKRETFVNKDAIEEKMEIDEFYQGKGFYRDFEQKVTNEENPAVVRHVRDINMNDKIFHCNECEFKTKWKISLRDHKRKHMYRRSFPM